MFVKYGLNKSGNKHISQKIQQETLDAPVFVPRTLGGKLAKRLREAEAKLGLIRRVKIVEEEGVTLTDLLTRSNPWQGKPCDRAKCQVWKM